MFVEGAFFFLMWMLWRRRALRAEERLGQALAFRGRALRAEQLLKDAATPPTGAGSLEHV